MNEPRGTTSTTVLTTVEPFKAALGTSRRRRRGRRGNNEGTIVQRKDGRWAGAVTTGLAQRRWVYGKTREEVARRVIDALKSTQDGVPIPGELETVERFLTKWLEQTVRPKVRPVTLVSYATIVRLHLIPELGAVRLSRLTPADVQGLLNRKMVAGLSPRRVEYIRGVLRQALGHAVKWGLLQRNVVDLTDRPRPTRQDLRPLDAQQALVFLHSVRGDRLEALYHLALALGMRQGELLGLRWDDVDLERGFVRVRRSLVRIGGQFVLTEPKTDRSARRLPLPSTLMETLRAHKRRQTEEQLAAPAWGGWDLVFTTPSGQPLHSKSVTKAFQAHVDAAGLPRQRFHDLRHACASLLMAQGVHPRVVMEVLGHATITTTMNTYTHVTEATQREALAGLSSSLSG
jgi:integrase